MFERRRLEDDDGQAEDDHVAADLREQPGRARAAGTGGCGRRRGRRPSCLVARAGRRRSARAAASAGVRRHGRCGATAALIAGSPRLHELDDATLERRAARSARGGRRSRSGGRCRRRGGRPARCRRRTDGGAGAGRRRPGSSSSTGWPDIAGEGSRGRRTASSRGRSEARPAEDRARGRGPSPGASTRSSAVDGDQRRPGYRAASWAIGPPARVSEPARVCGWPTASELDRVRERDARRP